MEILFPCQYRTSIRKIRPWFPCLESMLRLTSGKQRDEKDSAAREKRGGKKCTDFFLRGQGGTGRCALHAGRELCAKSESATTTACLPLPTWFGHWNGQLMQRVLSTTHVCKNLGNERAGRELFLRRLYEDGRKRREVVARKVVQTEETERPGQKKQKNLCLLFVRPLHELIKSSPREFSSDGGKTGNFGRFASE